MFGLGYADRRGPPVLHRRPAPPRAARSCRRFAGGAPGNRDMDAEQWAIAPVHRGRPAAPGRPARRPLRRRGRAAAARRSSNYVAGHQPVHRRGASSTRRRCRASTRRSASRWAPTTWKAHRRDRDGVAGRRRSSARAAATSCRGARCSQALQARFGGDSGTTRVARLPLGRGPRGADHRARQARSPTRCRRQDRRGSVALPDAGTVQPAQTRRGAERRGRRCATGDRRSSDGADLLGRSAARGDVERPARLRRASRRRATRSRCSARRSAYFAPADPDGAGRPRAGRSTRAAPPSPASNLYVQLGRGARLRVERDLGGPGHHRHVRGRPLLPGPRRRLDRLRSAASACRWRRSSARTRGRRTLADQTPRGHARRCARSARSSGIVIARGDDRAASRSPSRSCARPTCHEVDSARGFADFNDPDKMQDAEDFQRAADKIGYTFNWLYVDDKRHRLLQLGRQPGARRRDSTRTSRCARRSSSSGRTSTPTP